MKLKLDPGMGFRNLIILGGVWYGKIGNRNNILFPFLFLSGME